MLRLPEGAFDKVDTAPDTVFYAQPRFVTHIDDAALAALTSIYAELLPTNGDVLDVMSSWVSHLPATVFRSVVGHGLNAAELAANPRLTRWFVQDLNRDQVLPLQTASFGAACLCASVQYLQHPVEVFREVARVLRPAGPFIVAFSNRCFPAKAVAIWQALSMAEQHRLVAGYMQAAGFTAIDGRAWTPRRGDPLRAVIGRS